MDRFEVSRELLESFITRNMTQAEIADELTRLGGRKCSIATVRSLCKFYGISLKKRSRSYFVPVVNDQEVTNETNKNKYQEENMPEEISTFDEDILRHA